ncbi:MAG: hypothetical protein LBF13_01915 [Campylobacteraceae bacterium]|jgi:hypothetical protein|nr:hypothetical protein [Campylobacteraceae bacterium]
MGKIKMVLALLSILLLAGCCVDDESNSMFMGDCPIRTVNATIQCNGASCGSSLNASSGANVSVWSYKNSGTNSVNLNVSIYLMSNKDVTSSDKEITVVYTNEGNGYVTLPSIPIDTTLKNEVYPYEEGEEIFEFREPDFMRDEPPALIKQAIDPNLSQEPSFKVWSEGAKYNWSVSSDYSPVSRATTLRKQLIVNGRTINIWVEDSEYANGKMSAAKIDYIASNVGSVYANVVSMAGEPWGPHQASNLISSDQPLDIVFFNSGPKIGGYFNTINSYRKTSFSNSNEAVAIFICTRGAGSERPTLGVIAHELTHAIDFYQRFVVKNGGNQFNAFLGEMRAVMMEDVISGKISYNRAASRYKDWLSAPLYQQEFSDWKYSDPSSYAIASSFGSFLLRQYGVDFYKTLFKTYSGLSDYRAKEIDVLDKAIKVYDSGGLAKALRNWGASIAMFPAATAPKGFGYPEYNDNGFKLEAFDGNTYRQYRKLPTSSPATLAPNAHFPFLRKTTNNAYNESFVVPSGVSVSIVVK